jgi:hypothetical protein
MESTQHRGLMHKGPDSSFLLKLDGAVCVDTSALLVKKVSFMEREICPQTAAAKSCQYSPQGHALFQ